MGDAPFPSPPPWVRPSYLLKTYLWTRWRPPPGGAHRAQPPARSARGSALLQKRHYKHFNFNFPGIKWQEGTADSKGSAFLDSCNEVGLEQLIDFPTHTKGNILDLVLTNMPHRIMGVETAGKLGRSDHEMLLVEVTTAHAAPQQEQTKIPVWSRANWSAIRNTMADRDWRNELKDLTAEDAWAQYKLITTELITKYVPHRTRKEVDRPLWMTTELLQEIRRKRLLWKKFKASPTQQNQTAYKEAEKKTIQKDPEGKEISRTTYCS